MWVIFPLLPLTALPAPLQVWFPLLQETAFPLLSLALLPGYLSVAVAEPHSVGPPQLVLVSVFFQLPVLIRPRLVVPPPFSPAVFAAVFCGDTLDGKQPQRSK